jgi:hypothetical protein
MVRPFLTGAIVKDCHSNLRIAQARRKLQEFILKQQEGPAVARQAALNPPADANTVFSGKAWGPPVDYLGKSDSDILMDYVENALEKAGYTTDVNTPDSRFYHNRQGDIHCGTNVCRVRPEYKWWQ